VCNCRTVVSCFIIANGASLDSRLRSTDRRYLGFCTDTGHDCNNLTFKFAVYCLIRQRDPYIYSMTLRDKSLIKSKKLSLVTIANFFAVQCTPICIQIVCQRINYSCIGLTKYSYFLQLFNIITLCTSTQAILWHNRQQICLCNKISVDPGRYIKSLLYCYNC